MTGIPPETLRSWEARHLAVRPTRTRGGFRLYSAADVERLTLIRALTELGHPVGTIATLEAGVLRKRLGGDASSLDDEGLRAIVEGDDGLPEAVRHLARAIQALRGLVRSDEVEDHFPDFRSSLVELESLLLMLCERKGSLDP